MNRVVTWLSVAITGASVMVIELLGTRIVAPYYGTSLYVWSALIAVTMIALAIGYFTGGRCADRLPRFRLAHLVALAAIATAAIPIAAPQILAATESLGMRSGALASATALFLPALALLGAAGPLAIKLSASDLDVVGTSSGTIYAVSTLGSVAGTLLLGFHWLPLYGTRAILGGTALGLAALALLLAWFDRKVLGRKAALLVAALCAFSMVMAWFGMRAAPAGAAGFRVISEAESLYGWVRVVEDRRNDIRLLLSDASSIGAVGASTGESMLGYQHVLTGLAELGSLHSARDKAARKPRVLLIGLGVGYVATRLARHDMVVDTIEIDPEVARAARERFGFSPTGRFLVGDARYEVRHLVSGYDLIIHDCFTGGAEPTHLLTREFLGTLKALLVPDGVLALNYVGYTHGEGVEALAAVRATLRAVWTNQRVFATLPGAEFSDFIFLVGDRPVTFAWEGDGAAGGTHPLKRLEVDPATPRGVVLTDDFNPLEHLQIRKAERYRALFAERIAPELLLR